MLHLCHDLYRCEIGEDEPKRMDWRVRGSRQDVLPGRTIESFWPLHHLPNLKLVRLYKGKLLLSKTGKTLFGGRFQRFHRLAQYVLFEVTLRQMMRQQFGMFGNGDVGLNVMDIETTNGATGNHPRPHVPFVQNLM
ncbi:MAG TPA: hypothetical protein ENK83_03200, partial [Aliiroseovarius sp.]|nr:hypothetical protein [Aliiroseovarius sp.]